MGHRSGEAGQAITCWGGRDARQARSPDRRGRSGHHVLGGRVSGRRGRSGHHVLGGRVSGRRGRSGRHVRELGGGEGV